MDLGDPELRFPSCRYAYRIRQGSRSAYSDYDRMGMVQPWAGNHLVSKKSCVALVDLLCIVHTCRLLAACPAEVHLFPVLTMKKFLFLLLIFTFPLIILTVVPAVVEWSVYKAAIREPNKTIGLIGDSHAACGVDPRHFPQLANFATTASQPMVWGAKIDEILDANPQIGTFIIELWPGVMIRNAEKDSRSRAHYVRNFRPANILLDIWKSREMGGWPEDNIGKNFINGVLLPCLKRCFSGSRESELYTGFHGLDQKLADTGWYKRGAVVKDSWGHKPQTDKTAVREEVEDILRILNSRNVKAVILTVPLWPHYKNNVHTDEDRDWFDCQVSELCAKYDCRRIDLVDALPEIENYADDAHLNRLGAERATKLLKKALDDGQ